MNTNINSNYQGLGGVASLQKQTSKINRTFQTTISKWPPLIYTSTQLQTLCSVNWHATEVISFDLFDSFLRKTFHPSLVWTRISKRFAGRKTLIRRLLNGWSTVMEMNIGIFTPHCFGQYVRPLTQFTIFI